VWSAFKVQYSAARSSKILLDEKSLQLCLQLKYFAKQKPERQNQASTGIKPMTSAILVHCKNKALKQPGLKGISTL